MSFKTAKRFRGGRRRPKPQAFPTADKKRLPRLPKVVGIGHPLIGDPSKARYRTVQKYAKIEHVGNIANVPADFSLVTNAPDVKQILRDLGVRPRDAKDFGGLLVKVEGGEYKEVFAFTGVVPRLDKFAWKITPPRRL